MTPVEFAQHFVDKAKTEARNQSSSCKPTERLEKFVQEVYSGWSFVMNMYEHPADERSITHYCLSAKLYPPGRDSEDRDWGLLGEIIANIERASGRPVDAAPISPIVPIESIHPNSAIHWMWHDDGSVVDAELLQVTAEAVKSVQRREIEQAVQQGLASEVGRNEPCPCGSGKKFKKCHGGN